MFYSQFILAKKGPLGTIWIAAHLERKLRKNQITETNISDSVDSILYPEVPIALRLSGHLLLGVVRIYSRKVNYLFHDCSEALIKIKQAFHTSAVDLPPDAVIAPYRSITLPESFDFDELEAHLKRENVLQAAANRGDAEHHVTARDLITLQDQTDEHGYFRSFFTLDERFLEGGDPYSVSDFANEEHVHEKSGSVGLTAMAPALGLMTPPPVEDDVLPPLPMEDDMDLEGMEIDKNEAATPVHGLGNMEVDLETPSVVSPMDQKDSREFEPQPPKAPEEGALPQEPATTSHTPDGLTVVPDVEKLRAATEVVEHEPFMELEKELAMHNDTSLEMDIEDAQQNTEKKVEDDGGRNLVLEETPILREETPFPSGPQEPSPLKSPGATLEDSDVLGTILGGRTPNLEVMDTPVTPKRGQRKRKPTFDDIVAVSSSNMKKQLRSTSDLCRARRKAPSTEYEIWMSQRESHIEQKFYGPSIPGLCAELKVCFARVLIGTAKKSRPLCGASKLQVDQTEGERLANNDATIGADDLNPVGDADPLIISGLEESHNAELEAFATIQGAQPVVSLAGKSVDFAQEKEASVDEAQLHKPSSPDLELSVEQAARNEVEEFENGTEHGKAEQTEKEMEIPSSGTKVSAGREMENGAAAQTDVSFPMPVAESSEVILEVPDSLGLGFLADSKERDEALNEEASNDADSGYKQMGKLIQDNSGWSPRTRAVAQYLKQKFETLETDRKLDTDQAPKLSLDRLLTGRTRKEAARMFFEALVLRTKDYIQVEQDMGFADIQLLATPRLMKAVF